MIGAQVSPRIPKADIAAVAVADSAKNKKLLRWTVGPYSAGPVIGDLSYEVEGYYQSGSASAKRFKAYLYHGELEYQLKTAPVKPGIRAGYDAISGNQDLRARMRRRGPRIRDGASRPSGAAQGPQINCSHPQRPAERTCTILGYSRRVSDRQMPGKPTALLAAQRGC